MNNYIQKGNKYFSGLKNQTAFYIDIYDRMIYNIYTP